MRITHLVDKENLSVRSLGIFGKAHGSTASLMDLVCRFMYLFLNLFDFETLGIKICAKGNYEVDEFRNGNRHGLSTEYKKK